MIHNSSLADVIRSKLVLGPLNPRGFHELRCEVCHDHSPRAAFRFDGENVGFSCWNCGAKARYEEGTGRLSRNFRQILEAFGITKEDLSVIRSSLFSHVKKEEEDVTLDALKKVKLFTPEVSLPNQSFPIGVDHHIDVQLPIAEYLESRKIDPLKVKVHFSLDPRFVGRAVIPFYRDGKVIYWQARSIKDGIKPRYLNSSVSRDAVLYGYDQIFTWSDTPLFVTEGVFDAVVLDGVCTLGASLNSAKLEILKRCRRRVIFVIDRDKTGGVFGKTALEHGWEISFVDERVKDANRSVQVFGLPYTIYTLMQNATTKEVYPQQSQLQLSLGVMIGKLRGTK